MSSSIHLLSYNTHLFGGGPLDDVLPIYRDSQRADLIVDQLERSGADVIGLSEVWTQTMAERITSRLRGRYHAYRPPESLDLKFQTSGLLVLSRSPFIDDSCGFQPFSNLAFPDDQANKGVAWGRCELPIGGRTLRLLIFLTHTQADYPDGGHRWQRQKNIETVGNQIDNLRNEDDPDEAVVLLGDLNVTAEDGNGSPTSEYQETLKNLPDMHDGFRMAHPSAIDQPGYTYEGPTNTLIPRFSPNETSWRQRVDYHFLGGALVTGGRLTADIPSDDFTFEVQGRKENLSDHEPLRSTWTP
ncbi:MAG: endonuclease/exonuclease/phosphatase family protein [Acidobacteriota bacterium]